MSTRSVLLVLVVVALAALSESALQNQRGRDAGSSRSRFSLDRRLHRKFRGGRVKRPEYHGSGCPPNSLAHVNSSDESSFALSVLFSAFQAETSGSVLRATKKCFVTVELAVEPGMSVGIVHIDFRGFAYVPEDAPSETFAHLRASYAMLGARGLIAEREFASGFMDTVYEGMDFNPISYWIRIESAIVAQKAQLADEDVQIAIDSSDAALAKGRLEYAMVTRPCA